jgi:Zn-dependent protease with chaperone function
MKTIDSVATHIPQIYKTERPLFIIHLLLATIFWGAIIFLSRGIVLAYLVLFFIGYLFAQSALIAWIKGNGVKISAEQFPDLHENYLHCCQTLGLKSNPDAYLLNGGGVLNAFATRFLGRDFVVLFSNIVDAMSAHPESINFYIGHELGHIQRKHLRWAAFLSPASILPLLGAAYSRAREYTCDQFGLACCKNPHSALRGLVALAAGEKRWASLNLNAYLDQAKEVRGFWMSFHELVADYPWLVKRAARISNPTGTPPSRNPLSWLFALFVPRIGVGGSASGLLVTIALIGVLAAIALPAYRDYVKRVESYSEGAVEEESMSDESSFKLPENDIEEQETAAPTSTPLPSSIEEQLQMVADEVNKDVPKMLDSGTRLDGAVAGPGLRITYLYTFTEMNAAEVTPETVETSLVPGVTSSACSSGNLQPFFDQNISVIYQYRGIDGDDIAVVALTPDTCETL